jgi:hypothetical protein
MFKHTTALFAVALTPFVFTLAVEARDQAHEIVVLNDRDLARGYVVHWGGPDFPLSSARAKELAIGTNEKESFELGVLALQDLDKVTLSVLSIPQLPEEALRLRTMQGISTPMGYKKYGWGMLAVGRKGVDTPMEFKDYALLDGNELEMPQGAHKSFWLTLDGNRIPPGRYVLRLRVFPENAEPREVGLAVEVIDVPLRGQDDLHLMMYHTDHFLQQHQWEVFRKHLQLMRGSGQRQIRIDPGFGQHRRSVRFWRDDTGEIQADYSGIDRILKPAQEMGFDVFGWPTGGGVDPEWLSDEMKALPAEELASLKDELTRRFFQHILDLGYKEIWWYCIDEPSVERATDPKFIEMLKSHKQRFPMLRPHCALNVYRPIMANALNPYRDIWMTDQGIVAQMQKDIAEGAIKIDSTDLLGPYGAGYYHSTPDGLRRHAWFAASRKTTYYAYFAYASKPAEKAHCFACPTGSHGGMPYSTPALEGVREGYEDLAYWHTLDVMIDESDKQGNQNRSSEAKAAIAAARAFRARLQADTSEESLIPWAMSAASEHRGFAAHRRIQGDRWLFREVKGPLLRHIETLQKVLKD